MLSDLLLFLLINVDVRRRGYASCFKKKVINSNNRESQWKPVDISRFQREVFGWYEYHRVEPYDEYTINIFNANSGHPCWQAPFLTMPYFVYLPTMYSQSQKYHSHEQTLLKRGQPSFSFHSHTFFSFVNYFPRFKFKFHSRHPLDSDRSNKQRPFFQRRRINKNQRSTSLQRFINNIKSVVNSVWTNRVRILEPEYLRRFSEVQTKPSE